MTEALKPMISNLVVAAQPGMIKMAKRVENWAEEKHKDLAD